MSLASGRTLHSLVEKWFGPVSQTPLRVTRVGRAQSNRAPCVHIELLSPKGPMGLFFFRHCDGSWWVFPPEADRLAMRVH
nr:hypothetical protein [Caballeronia ptereochthonis]